MVRIKGIIFLTFIFCFSLISIVFITIWEKDIISYNRKSSDYVIESNYKLSLERIEKSDEYLCNIIDTIQTSLSRKIINTTDRVLLNLFFTTILQKNPFIKTFELVLPNKYEYKIIPTSSGWKTISLTSGEKGFLKKTANWTEDGIQLLEENIEEVSSEQSLTNNAWYKEAISLCLQQSMQNRQGIPKIWFTFPEINEMSPMMNSRMAMAIGYEDSPYSVISWEIDWSWLQNIMSDIYRDYSVYTYILSNKYVVCKLGMESVSNRDIIKSASLQNLPEEIKEIISAHKDETNPYLFKKTDGLIVVQRYLFMYNIPLLCVFDIHQSFSMANIKVYTIFLLFMIFIILVFAYIILGSVITRPIKKISHWLENPKVEGQEPPLHFWVIEYETLMNKIYSILYFWKFWAVDIKEKGDEIVREDLKEKRDRDIFIFSEEGRGGIPIETVNSLYRENIRLQRQIESLNQYYLNKIDGDNKEKLKIQGFVIALRDIILISNDKDKDLKEKIKDILEIMQNTLKTENSGIWQVEEDRGTLVPLFVISDDKENGKTIDNCKFIIENLEWSEVLAIRSAKQDYRSNMLTKSLDAESFIFAPIRTNKNKKTDKILITYNKEPKNWDMNDENFVIIVSKILFQIYLT